MSVRFDDLTCGGASFELTDRRDVIAAYHVGAVVGVIAEAERWARDGAWVAGFVAYEAAAGLDPALHPGPPDPRLPLAWFAAFADQRPVPPPPQPSTAVVPTWTLGWQPAQHATAVGCIRAAEAAGDTYQVNLTGRAHASIDDSAQLYATVAWAQRGAYNAHIDTGDAEIVSASPELFFRRDRDRLLCRPMKGTSQRGRWSDEDAAAAAGLAASAKDRAEHVMIVDLVRNDLGRVARPGTVTVEAFYQLEPYPTVWQATSTVAARVPEQTPLADIFVALFPCGSVTGAPKPRTVELISQLEDSPRGVYCGAVGWIAPGAARSQFSVAIRTATVIDRRACYGAGGGITWGSDPASEWAELVAKCSILQPVCRPTGLFETLGFDPPRGPVNLDRHLSRLAASARYFDIPFDRLGVEEEVDKACAGRTDPARVRIVVPVAGESRVELSAFPHHDPDVGPVRLGLAPSGVDSHDVHLFHKLLDRSRYDQARAARAATDDVVLWNERGEATETTIANLAVRLDGRWWTPPLDCGLLPGVERHRLIEAGRLAERVVRVEELAGAEGLAVVNSLRGWRPAVWMDP